MAAIWIDETTYSQDDKDRVQMVWKMEVPGAFWVYIIRGHRHYPGQWLLNCSAFHIENLVFAKTEDTTPEQAQKKALFKLLRTAEDYANALKSIL